MLTNHHTAERAVHPLDEACQALGGRTILAERLGVTRAAIGNWKVRGVPIEHCAAIEMFTGGVVTRSALRPMDWRRIWPELASDQQQQAEGQGA